MTTKSITQYVIVHRLTGELYDGGNIKRFYDMVSSAQGQIEQPHLYTILAIQLGAKLKIEQVDRYRISEKDFYHNLGEHINQTKSLLADCVQELDDRAWETQYYHDLLRRNVTKFQNELAWLKSLRYDDLMYQ